MLQIISNLGFKATQKFFHLTHLNRLVGGDEWKHKMETRVAGGRQESPSPVLHTQTHTVDRYILE